MAIATTTCTTCHGRRVVTQLVPNMKGPSGNQYQSAITPMKPINRQCPECKGAGCVVDLDLALEAAILAANDEAVMEVHYEYERAHAGHPDIEANPALDQVPY